tara:strand:- start:63 stop:776 length:714 start_codon:yes stop_codon:yes gene_type:complete
MLNRTTLKRALTGAAVAASAMLVACQATQPTVKDYSAFRAENPQSILVLPALNNSGSVTAPEFFLSTISQPFAQRGYYVFPANMVKSLLEEEGLADPSLLYEADAKRLGNIFGCDSALYLAIQKWESQYMVLATSTNVAFDYELRSCKTGDVLWSTSKQIAYSPQASNSGNPLADLIAQAVISAIEKGSPNYIPLAQQANAAAANFPGQGLPAGPYLPEQYGNDLEYFPAGQVSAQE